MAIVLRTPKGVASPPGGIRAAPVDVSGLSLPTTRSEPVKRFEAYTWLLYGEPGVGKTSLAGNIDGTMCLMGEPGGKALRIFQRNATTWPLVCGYVKLLEGPQGKPFKNIMLDGIELMYKACFSYMCDKLAITHPTDANDYGKSWDAINGEFAGIINRLITLDKGLWFIAHAHVKQHQDRSGMEYTKLKPNLTNGAWNVLEPLVDMVAYYGKFSGGERRLIIRGDDYTEAKTRPLENFLTTKGEEVMSIDMGKNYKEAMRNIRLGFDNKLTETGYAPIIKQKPPSKK